MIVIMTIMMVISILVIHVIVIIVIIQRFSAHDEPGMCRTSHVLSLQSSLSAIAMQKTSTSDSVLTSSKYTHMTQSSVMCLQILRQMAQRMQLRHPNLATVLGVSCEPVTGDPLLVRLYAWHSNLAQHHTAALPFPVDLPID